MRGSHSCLAPTVVIVGRSSGGIPQSTEVCHLLSRGQGGSAEGDAGHERGHIRQPPQSSSSHLPLAPVVFFEHPAGPGQAVPAHTWQQGGWVLAPAPRDIRLMIWGKQSWLFVHQVCAAQQGAALGSRAVEFL